MWLLNLPCVGHIRYPPPLQSSDLSSMRVVGRRQQPRGCVLAALALALRAPLRSPLVSMSQVASGRSQLQLDQDRAVAARAEKERSLLQEGTALEALVQKGGRANSGAGFGAAGLAARPPTDPASGDSVVAAAGRMPEHVAAAVALAHLTCTTGQIERRREENRLSKSLIPPGRPHP